MLRPEPIVGVLSHFVTLLCVHTLAFLILATFLPSECRGCLGRDVGGKAYLIELKHIIVSLLPSGSGKVLVHRTF